MRLKSVIDITHRQRPVVLPSCLAAAAMVSQKYVSLCLNFLFIAGAIASDLRRVLPLSLQIREGEDLQLRLTNVVPEMISCYVRTPLLTNYNLISEESDSDGRIGYWTENGECGFVVKGVTKADQGRWRLTAKNSTNTLVDAASVVVLDKYIVVQKNFSIKSGLGYTLTLEEQSKYCWVHQPHSDETILIAGKCDIDLQQPTAAEQGVWRATTGVIGQVQEVSTTAELSVFRDKLATGFKKNNKTSSISAYCNLRNSNEALEFCRFEKPDAAKTGFQLSDGLHSGRYGYYGAGLARGECGITITSPSNDDYGQWQCSVGIKDEEPFGSFVHIRNSITRASTVTAAALPTDATTTVLGKKLQLRCEATVALSYCWFLAPNGEIFTPRPVETQDDATHKYIGNGFGKGQCGIEITAAKSEYQGKWMCHMGPEVSGFELTSAVDVRISETHLAAENQKIGATDGRALTITCRTVPDRISLDYCRFLMPDGTGIHIGDEITQQNPLVLDGASYWFSGLSMRLGGCGITVGAVSSRHFGNWTCAALLEISETTGEAKDEILVRAGASPVSGGDSGDSGNRTAAATSGIVSGVLILAALLVAGSLYAVKKFKVWRRQDNVSVMNMVNSETASSRSSSSSTNSGISLQEIGRNTAVNWR